MSCCSLKFGAAMDLNCFRMIVSVSRGRDWGWQECWIFSHLYPEGHIFNSTRDYFVRYSTETLLLARWESTWLMKHSKTPDFLWSRRQISYTNAPRATTCSIQLIVCHQEWQFSTFLLAEKRELVCSQSMIHFCRYCALLGGSFCRRAFGHFNGS